MIFRNLMKYLSLFSENSNYTKRFMQMLKITLENYAQTNKLYITIFMQQTNGLILYHVKD